MRSKLRTALATTAAAALVLGSAGLAVADDLFADGDQIAALADSDVELGTVCVSQDPMELSVPVAIKRQGKADNTNDVHRVFAAESQVSVEVDPVLSPRVTATMDESPAVIELPQDWTSSPSGNSDPVASTVTIDVSSPGLISAVVTYRATGTEANGGSMVLTDSMTVTGAVSDTGDCAPVVTDETPPVLTPDVSGTMGDNDWYTSDVTVSWTVADDESDITETSGCETVTVDYDTTGETFTCSATSAGGTTTESVTVKRDATAPTFQCEDPSGEWSADDATLVCTADDATSGLVGDKSFVLSTDVAPNTETDDAQTGSRELTDEAGNSITAGPIGGNKVDKKAPSVTCDPADGQWHGDNVEVVCTAEDLGSSLADPADAEFTLTTSVADGDETADASTNSRTVYDMVGNSSTAGPIVGNKVDRKKPQVTWTAGPDDQATYYFGDEIPEALCEAVDGGSGVDGECVVSGYSTEVGEHTLTATATDKVGNKTELTRTYTVLAWTIDGFYRPVDMDKVNAVKAGSTVPLKFNVFKGEERLESGIGATFSAKRTSCEPGLAADAIEEFATTGGTTLRYDEDADQWIQNWATPKSGAGNCYLVTVTTADGSSESATFFLK